MRYQIVMGVVSVALSLSLSGQGFAQGWQPPTNLGSNVNTSNLEDGNSISQDGTKLYLSTDRPGGYGGFDIWVSEYIGGVWQVPTNLGANLNTSYDEMEPSISSDGSKLRFSSSRPGGYGQFDIWVSENVGGVWQPPTNLGDNINTSEYDGCPSISSDGLTLYFASSRAGGYGLYDLWVSEYVGGMWQPPTNLGPNVNTAEFEGTPSISSDGLTLYFASSRAGGYGWYDIWVSEYVGGEWQSPDNLGASINTGSGECGPSISNDGLTLYFAAYEWPGGYGGYDIWVSEYEVGVNEQEPPSVGQTNLGRVQPNPFSRVTEINFTLPASARTTLRVYDASGRLVATLVESQLSAGVHTVTWQTGDAPSGVYYCKLTAGDSTATKKMVVLR